jgi:AraC-like DNA-binding protein
VPIDHDLFVRLSRSRDYLADFATDKVTVEAAAAEANISPFHYIRLFQRAFRQTPHRFVQERRISLARRMLASSNMSITDVCLATGYESLGSFSSLFRQATAMSPSEFRRFSSRVFAIRWAGQPLHIPTCFLAYYGVTLPDDLRSQFSRRISKGSLAS